MRFNDSARSVMAESYRSLRTNIQYSAVDKDLKVISVTSSFPGEGKSTVAANLAYTMSEMGKKTVLIDGDLRKPTIHKKMNLSNLKGLTDAIIYKLEFSEFIQYPFEYFHVITSGKIPPNPAEIVGSEAMTSLIKRLKEEYDYIIIDCPPVLSVTDPLLIATKVDGTILVVQEGKTRAKQVLNSLKQLEKVHANVIGTVLNDSKEIGRKATDYYYPYEDGEAPKKRFKLFKRKSK